MLLAGTVAGFAGDPEFSDPGVARYPRIEEVRLAAGTVAAHAVFIPHLGGLDLIVRAKKAVLVGNPALLCDEPREGKEKEGAPFARAEPIDLLVVGAGGQHGALLYPLCLVLRAHEIPVDVAPSFAELGIHHVHPEFLPDSVEVVITLPDGQGRVPVREHRIRTYDLGHGPVKTSVPRGILSRMAGPAGLRGDISELLCLDGSPLCGGVLQTPRLRAAGAPGWRSRRWP